MLPTSKNVPSGPRNESITGSTLVLTQALVNAGAIDLYCDQFAVLREEEKENRYHKDTGLLIPDTSGGQAVFF